jgi:DNA-binding NarL/FixJ family response regulator
VTDGRTAGGESLDAAEDCRRVVGGGAESRRLSGRERQVLSLMTEGLSNVAIAERLSISEKTVRNHASNLFDKLGVWSRAQAMVFARDRGFGR